MSQTELLEREADSKVLKIKVTKLDNLIEWLQKKLVVNQLLIPILKPYFRGKEDSDIRHNELTKNIDKFSFFKNLPSILNPTGADSDLYYEKDKYLKLNLPLFEIRKVFIQDSFYVFESDDWNFYHANIEDFDKNWIMSLSLKRWKPDLNTSVNTVNSFIINTTKTSIQLVKNGSVISSIVWELIVVVDKDIGDAVVVNDNKLEYINIDKNWNQTDEKIVQHPFWVIEKLRIDNNSNFLLVVSRYDECTKLHILNRKTLECYETIDDITDIVQIDNKNDITCLDNEERLVSIDTNFDQFPKWFVDNWKVLSKAEQKVVVVQDLPKAELSQLLLNWWINIDGGDLSSSVNSLETSTDTRELIKQLWEIKVWDSTIKELLAQADCSSKIDIVYKAFLKIQSNPIVQWVKWITDDMEFAINQKRFQIKMNEMSSELKKLKSDMDSLHIDDSNYFAVLTSLELSMKSLKKLRSQIPLIDKDLDDLLRSINLEIESKILNYREENIQQILDNIEVNFGKIEDFLSWIDYLPQITNVYKTDIRIQTESMIEYLESNQKSTYTQKLTSLVIQRQQQISSNERRSKHEQEIAMKNKVQEIRWYINQIRNIVESVDDEGILDIMKNSDALVIKVKNLLWDIPLTDAEKLNLELSNTFEERKLKIKLQRIESRWVVHSLDEYGISTSLYYTDRAQDHIDYKIVGDRQRDWTIKLKLQFDWQTYFDVDKYLLDPMFYADALISDEITPEMSQSEFIKFQKNLSNWNKFWKSQLLSLRDNLIKTDNIEEKSKILENIKSLRENYKLARLTDMIAIKIAQKLNVNPRPYCKQINPKFIVLEEEKDLIKKMSDWFMIQKKEQKWIEILEWGPWLGKTEVCNFVAAATNREVIRVQCSKMDPTEMFFAPQLVAWEVVRTPAEWIKLMQKPWTLILFDEIDKLTPACFDRLHSLFDGWRSIYDPQLWSFRANEDCLFVWTRNSYHQMSNPIVSRSVIIPVLPPSPLNEAYKITRYTNNSYLENVGYNEFKTLWEKYITNYQSPSNSSTDKKIYDIIININSLVKIFSKVREKQSSDDFDEKFEYELSYRDAEQIFFRFEWKTVDSFKKIVKEILIPKARAVVLSKEDKDMQEKHINKIIDEVF